MKEKNTIFIGLILFFIGILCNQWVLAAFYSPGSTLDLKTKVIIWPFNLILISTGLIVLIGKKISNFKLIAHILCIFCFILLLFVFDVSVGLFYNMIAPPYGKRNLEIFLGNINKDIALDERPHPYLLFENTPNYISNEGIKQTNQQGYRNQEDILPFPNSDTFRVLCLGGSTTYGYLLDNPKQAWPNQLQEILNNEIEKNTLGKYNKVEVINGGLKYATSAELLSHYLFRDRYLGAKIVIIHTGGNDAVPLIFHDYDPEYADFRPGWNAPYHNLRKGEKKLISFSNIIKLFYAFWLNDNVALPHINKRAKLFNSSEEYYIENASRNSPLGFERNMDLLVRNIIADEAMPILFPFVLASDKTYNNLRPNAAKRAAYTKKIRKGMIIALNKNKDVIWKLSKKYHSPLIALDQGKIPVEYFFDHAHLSKEGEKIKAAFVAEYIITILWDKEK